MKDYFEAKLDILQELLEKKEEALTQILRISENQSTVLTMDTAEGADFFREMNEEKQKCIDEVLNNDKAFQSMFNDLGDEFEQKGKLYKEKVRILQEKIKAVSELDIQIRLRENKNKMLSNRPKQETSVASPKISKNKLLKEYKNNSRR